MKLLAVIAAVLVAWFLLRKRDYGTGAASSDSNELDYLNAQYPTMFDTPDGISTSGENSGDYYALALAIGQAEGYGRSASNIPTRANNPGDLELGDIGYGTVTAAGGQKITVFQSAADGWAALNRQIDKIFSGRSKHYTPDMSLQQFGSIYSGGSPTYGDTLANVLGLDSSAPLSQAR